MSAWFASLPPMWRMILGLVLGAAVGAAYGHFIGCRTGACPLTSNGYRAGLFGAIVGVLLLAPSQRRPAEAPVPVSRPDDRRGG